jgi:phage replication O-like protein O
MANPQLEDGHTKIANELVDKFATIDLSPYEWRVLWAILRKTYGWNKKSDFISLTQFSKITNIPPQHVARTISRLIERNLIYKKNGNIIMEYGLQKDYSKWITDNKTVPMVVLPIQVIPIKVVPTTVIPDMVLPTQDKGTTSTGTPPMPESTTSTGSNKSNIKDNITKDIYSHWNKKNIIVHLKLTDKMERKITTSLKDYTQEDIVKSIDNYAEVLSHPEIYYFTYKWTLIDFLQRGLERFMDNATPLINFKKDEKNGTNKKDNRQNRAEGSGEGGKKFTDGKYGQFYEH